MMIQKNGMVIILSYMCLLGQGILQNLKKEIINNLNSKNIKVLDLTDYFDKIDNIEQYYPLGFLGHYNSKGYQKIAEIIEKSLD